MLVRRYISFTLATVGRSDRAFVFEIANATLGREAHFAVQEVLVADVERRRHQPIDGDLCAGAKQDAVGIDEKDAAVRLQGTDDLRRVLSDHTIEHAAARTLLDEARHFAAADRKALPVDHRPGCVSDRQRIALLRKPRLDVDDLRPQRIDQRSAEAAGDE